jgi:hypothetical protein
MTRFILIVGMAFITAFVGVAWATRGFPLLSFEVIHPLQPLTNATFGDQSAKAYERKMWEAEHTAQSDGDTKLDKIRLEALQTANAYTLSPCGEVTKLNLIAAVTAYTRAWQKKMDCPRPQNMLKGMLMSCSDKKMKEAADTFSTPLDMRVQAALHEAFEQRGIVKADFPADIRFDVLHFAGPGLWSEESPICLPRMRAAGTAR